MEISDSIELIEFLPINTIMVGSSVRIRNGSEDCFGDIVRDFNDGFYECNFGGRFEKEIEHRYYRTGIFSKFSLTLSDN